MWRNDVPGGESWGSAHDNDDMEEGAADGGCLHIESCACFYSEEEKKIHTSLKLEFKKKNN